MMRVIGIGNPDRGDDAAGWVVAERLAPVVPTHLSSGEPAGLIEAWEGADDVVLVDSTCCQRAPGSITIVDLLTQRLAPNTVRSSHGLGPLEAVELARAMGALPRRLTLVGIEGACWDHGEGLSRAVERAVARVVDTIGRWNWEP